jgi:hypothetical protein
MEMSGQIQVAIWMTWKRGKSLAIAEDQTAAL